MVLENSNWGGLRTQGQIESFEMSGDPSQVVRDIRRASLADDRSLEDEHYDNGLVVEPALRHNQDIALDDFVEDVRWNARLRVPRVLMRGGCA